jgi:hypothetical protein
MELTALTLWHDPRPKSPQLNRIALTWQDLANRMAEENHENPRMIRQAVKWKYGRLFVTASAALVAADPIGLIADGAPPDEYDPEVGTVLPRLSEARSAQDVEQVLLEEFIRWFSVDAAGPSEKYRAVSVVIWQAWQEYRTGTR